LVRSPGQLAYALAAGLVNGFIVSAFAVVFGILIFDSHPKFRSRIGLGIHINLVTAMVACGTAVVLSRSPVGLAEVCCDSADCVGTG
jgi:hypothetical protein